MKKTVIASGMILLLGIPIAQACSWVTCGPIDPKQADKKAKHGFVITCSCSGAWCKANSTSVAVMSENKPISSTAYGGMLTRSRDGRQKECESALKSALNAVCNNTSGTWCCGCEAVHDYQIWYSYADDCKLSEVK